MGINYNIEKIYLNYVEKAKNLDKPRISMASFKNLLLKVIDILMFKKKSEFAKSPWMVVRIDPYFVLYVCIEESDIIVNVWDNIQLRFLMQDKNIRSTVTS